MIKDLVDVYTGLIQLLLLGLLVLGAWLGHKLIPDELTLAEETFKPNGFVKVLMGGGATFLAEAILFGPFLVLLDMRNAIRSVDDRIAAQNAKLGETVKK